MKTINEKLIEKCYKKSIELLQTNSSDFGVLASSPQKKAKERNYLSIFGRDAGICSLGMVASGNKKLIATARKSLENLIKAQALEGQIPNYVKPQKKYSDFWRMGCIDATLWWLIAVDFFDKHAGQKNKFKIENKKQIIKALYWLECQKHEQDKLLIQNEASDWADLMPRTGKVLYANVLWYKASQLYDLKIKNEVKENFNNIFFPFDKDIEKIPRCDRGTVKLIKKQEAKQYYLSFINYLFWGNDIDVFGNSLSLLFGLADKKTEKKIINFILKHPQNKDLPKPVLFNPIKEDSKLWRKYMDCHSQNYPYQYHNGGVWPFASCFWVMALAKTGKKKEALAELKKIAEALSHNDWAFQEWFHAQTGRAHGMHGQSWNAGAFLLAYHFIKKDFKI